MAFNRSGSILAVDFGNVTTRAVLLDIVEGAYQLIAQADTRTTAGFPSGDVSVGMRRVIEDISDSTGRRLFNPDNSLLMPEQPDRSGVDHVLTTASIGRPLRTILIGLVPDVSIASGQRATAGTYVQIVETISLDDVRSEEAQINAIVLNRPDLIFIVGGTEGGARKPILSVAERVLTAMMLMISQRKPAVLFAGNSDLSDEIEAMFSPLTTVFIAPNVRPSLDEEALEAAQLQLALAFNALSTQRGAGFEKVGEMSPFGVLPTAQSYNLIVDYLGQALPNGALTVDVGSAVSTLSLSVGGRLGTTIRTDIGMGHSVRDLLTTVGVESLRQWLPFSITEQELNNFAWNKTLRPAGVPDTIREFYLEYAFLRAGLRLLVEATRPTFDPTLADTDLPTLPPYGLAIGAGATLTATGRPELSALLLLDGLQPLGMTELQIDPYAVVAALGAVARVNTTAVVQMLQGSALLRLGTSFSVAGLPQVGRPALRVRIASRDEDPVIHEVMGGHLWVHRVPEGKLVEVDVRVVGRGLSLNGRRRLRMTVEGGAVGLIFDARGRPLPLSDDLRRRASQLTGWVTDVTGNVVHQIPDEWLIQEELPAAPAQPSAASSGGRKKAAKPPKPPKERKERSERKRRGKQEQPEPVTEGDEMDELRNLLS
jgi:hypothetical protein